MKHILWGTLFVMSLSCHAMVYDEDSLTSSSSSQEVEMVVMGSSSLESPREQEPGDGVGSGPFAGLPPDTPTVQALPSSPNDYAGHSRQIQDDQGSFDDVDLGDELPGQQSHKKQIRTAAQRVQCHKKKKRWPCLIL